VRRVAQTGVHVVLATGRAPWDGIAELADELGLDGPQITMQGALIGDPRTGRIDRLRSIPASTYLDGLRFAEALGIDPVVGLLDGHRATRIAPEADVVAAGPGLARYRTEGDLRSLTHSTPVRLFLPTGPARHRHVRGAASVWFARNASVVWSDLSGIELLGPGTDKGAAVAWLANRMGISPAEVAAVGDAPNDMAMLRYAGRSAAMGGSPDEVVRLADFVVPPSGADGVLSALAGFFPDLAEELGRPALPAPVRLDAYRHRHQFDGPPQGMAG
jgi:hydroxymethylpyrimidine pyrophosphatase-like HAD family hydrolase